MIISDFTFSLVLAQSNAVSSFDKLVTNHPIWTLVIMGGALGVVVVFNMLKKESVAASDEQFRHLVAKSVLYSAIWGLVILAIFATVLGSTKAKDILTLLLPVFGTWVGTLLAYYFGKDNYESGARNSANLARVLTGMEKLKSIPVTQPGIIIPLAEIDIPASVKDKTVADYDKVILKTLLSEMKKERLPLFDPATGAIVAILHKSLINGFLVKKGGAAFDTSTLEQLLADVDAGNVAKQSFAVIPNTSTLADAKEAMLRQQASAKVSCEDAFITSPGGTRVEGWITNDIIDKNSQA